MMHKTPDIQLRPTTMEDLDTLFEFQRDEESGYMAAFMSEDPTDKTAYLSKYTKLLSDPTINSQTILLNNYIVGSVGTYLRDGKPEVTYWIDKKYWGQGIATIALKTLLAMVTTRPVFGCCAFDNVGSRRVLEKCGFVKIGTDKGYANARKTEIAEFIFKLSH